MTIETLYADAHVSGTVSTPNNALGSTTGTWTSDTGNVSWTSVWSMGNPTGAVGTGTHTINVVARKQTGTGNPAVDSIAVYQGGTLVATVASGVSVTSATGQTISGTFDPSGLTDLTDVRIEIATTGAGGSPSARAAVQVDTIQWTGDFSAVSSVSSSVATSWHTRTPITQSVASSWRVIGRVEKTAQTSWNVRTPVQKTQSTSWITLVPVGAAKEVSSSWHVRARLTSSSSTSWNTQARVAPATRGTTWDTRAATDPTVTFWTGVSEIACTVTIWNGTAEVPITVRVTE